MGTSTQVFFEPRAGSLCFVKSTTGSKIDIHTTLRAGNPAANDACIKGPAPRYIGAVESTETMLARKMGNDEILCKHGQGADQPAKWACDCAP